MRVHAPLRVGGLSSEDPPRRCRSPYEKRILDMIKTGGASSEKRMYKYAKQRVRVSPCCRVGLGRTKARL